MIGCHRGRWPEKSLGSLEQELAQSVVVGVWLCRHRLNDRTM